MRREPRIRLPQSNAGPQPGTVEDGYRFRAVTQPIRIAGEKI